MGCALYFVRGVETRLRFSRILVSRHTRHPFCIYSSGVQVVLCWMILEVGKLSRSESKLQSTLPRNREATSFVGSVIIVSGALNG